jgi:flagellar basal body rod protein FlgB
MEDVSFKTALAAVISDDYCESDVKTLKNHLRFLNDRERFLKKTIEKETTDFVKNKDKHQSELKIIRGDIKTIKNILKNV